MQVVVLVVVVVLGCTPYSSCPVGQATGQRRSCCLVL
jgi:hypothetical protein